jgi:hypothetical protein
MGFCGKSGTIKGRPLKATPKATYWVLSDDPRYRAIVGAGPAVPTLEASALLREWDRMGFRTMAIGLARQLGAAVVVLRDGAHEPTLAAEFAGDPDAR